MTMGVVDPLEPVDVEHRHRKGVAVALGKGEIVPAQFGHVAARQGAAQAVMADRVQQCVFGEESAPPQGQVGQRHAECQRQGQGVQQHGVQ